jgi:hypothetical protein
MGLRPEARPQRAAARTRLVRAALLLPALLMALGAAPPGLPSSFWGTVDLEGLTLTPDMRVYTYVEDVLCGEGSVFWHEGQAHYRVHAAADDPGTDVRGGGRPGDMVRFRVAGIDMPQVGIWQGGTNVRLDLALGTAMDSGESVVAVSATPTGSANQAPVDALPSAPMLVWQPVDAELLEAEAPSVVGRGARYLIWVGGLACVAAGGWWAFRQQVPLRLIGRFRRPRVGA